MNGAQDVPPVLIPLKYQEWYLLPGKVVMSFFVRHSLNTEIFKRLKTQNAFIFKRSLCSFGF